MVKFIRRAGNVLLRPAGLAVGGRNPGPGEIVPLAALTQSEAAGHLSWLRDKLGFSPQCIADLGASDGRWAEPAIRLFPKSRMLLVEPQPDYRASLQALELKYPGVCYEICAVGEQEGHSKLFCHGHQTSLYGDSCGRAFGSEVIVPVKTLDFLISQHELPWPDLIKMDIQGAEIQALRGAQKCLQHAEFVQTEFSLLPIQKGIPLLDDLVLYLSARGFRIFNIYGVCGRPLDGMPAQGEALFIKKDSHLVTDYRWSVTSAWS